MRYNNLSREAVHRAREFAYRNHVSERKDKDLYKLIASAWESGYHQATNEEQESMSVPGEIWKPVVGYEGRYEVSNYGRIKGLRYFRDHNIFLHASVNRYGYEMVTLFNTRDGRKMGKGYCVHRLVAAAFIPNPENKPHIDHIDGDRRNNRVENLRWCTPKENNNYPIAKERRRAGQTGIKKNYKPEYLERISTPVVQLSKEGECIAKYPSIKAAMRAVGAIRTFQITNICRGRGRTYKGYKWMFLKDYEQYEKSSNMALLEMPKVQE